MRLLFIFLAMVVCFSGVSRLEAAEVSSCVGCHGDEAKMEKLGFKQLYLDPKEIMKEVNMGDDITCVDCHLGNSEGKTADAAHEGMPRPFFAVTGKNYKYQAIGRSIADYPPISPKGDAMITLMRQSIPEKMREKFGINVVNQLFFHDRDMTTMAYNPSIAEQTCGKCHDDVTADYSMTGMGLQKYQRGYTGFTDDIPGPQNCGAWFGDNYQGIKDNTTNPAAFTRKMSDGLDRGCNKCHASCNDCHYQDFEKSKARHIFSKTPATLSCYGGGRGEICHAGPMDRRRGAGFVRGEYAFPQKVLSQDVHYEAGLTCTDCHKQEKHDFGHLGSAKTRAVCADCHEPIVEALKQSDHKNVDCTSCHIKEVGAYQFTFWGPGKSEGQDNIYTKHKEYYGVRNLPLIVYQPDTKLWIPVKPYPMSVMNIATDKIDSGKLLLRKINKTVVKGNTSIGQPEEFIVERSGADVNDMYVITGISDVLKKNDNILSWIQMDKMSHSIGKPRACDSCHASNAQQYTSTYEYKIENYVKKPFTGSYTVTADKNGMRFENFKNSEIVSQDGRSLEDFAPFVIDETLWNVKGIDFEIKFNKAAYQKSDKEYSDFKAKIEKAIVNAKNDELKGKLLEIKIISHHNLKLAVKQYDALMKSK